MSFSLMGLVLFVIIRWRVTSEKSYKAVVLSGGQGGPCKHLLKMHSPSNIKAKMLEAKKPSVRPERTTFPIKIIW